MPKAPFNTTYDAYYGPSGFWGPPGTVYVFNAPCRLVYYDNIFFQDGVSIYETAWLTFAGDPLYGPAWSAPSPGVAQGDYGASTQIAIPSGSAPQWVQSQYELVAGVLPVGYWRARLIPLPLPF
jgi:hypothetical protein